ncbi:MAG: hypothetical protein SGI71_11480, partial [Verrucomicrobiota bacterium]|nr:hypothetical protein [Verrucomicrobiota bacterium]
MRNAGHLAGGIAGRGYASLACREDRPAPRGLCHLVELVSCGSQFGEGGGEEGGGGGAGGGE